MKIINKLTILLTIVFCASCIKAQDVFFCITKTTVQSTDINAYGYGIMMECNYNFNEPTTIRIAASWVQNNQAASQTYNLTRNGRVIGELVLFDLNPTQNSTVTQIKYTVTYIKQDGTQIGPFYYASQDCTNSTGCCANYYQCNLSVAENITSKTCDRMGSIELTTSGGTSPYIYDWSDISGTNNIGNRTGLDAGTYNITVTDSRQCKFTASYTVISNCNPTCQAITDNIKPELTDWLLSLNDQACKKWDVCTDANVVIRRDGKVAIGTTNVADGYRLGVNGGVISDAVKIQLCSMFGWCDYVFEPTYPLMSLDKVANFIKNNHHLPNTPSSSDIEKSGGIELKTASLNHQEKIEEIFLHLIDLKKDVEESKNLLSSIQKHNNIIKRLLNNK